MSLGEGGLFRQRLFQTTIGGSPGSFAQELAEISFSFFHRKDAETQREKELRRRIQEDVHSPAICRVNGVLYNVPDFYNAFNISDNFTFMLNYTRIEKKSFYLCKNITYELFTKIQTERM